MLEASATTNESRLGFIRESVQLVEKQGVSDRLKQEFRVEHVILGKESQQFRCHPHQRNPKMMVTQRNLLQAFIH